MTPALMPQPLANFVQPGSQPIALPRWSRFHAVPDFAQALAHAHTMLATAFPFLPIGRNQTARSRQEGAATENGYETTTSSHDAPLPYASTERTTECDGHSAL
jgi:hypothetical protein